MERKVTVLEHSHVEVLVVVDETSWKAAQKKAFEKQAADVQVAGFRKGKAPENLVKSKVNQAKVMDDAINAILPVAYREIIEKDGIKPFAQPKVDVTKLSDTELEIKFLICTAPTLELGEYKGLKVGHTKVEVTDEEVETAVADKLKADASLVVKEDAAANGDTVVLDFKGTVDGVEFEGGTAENYELELGSNTFIPGFEAQLVGKKAGEHVDVKVTFPAQYVKDLAGKEAVFACDIHEVKSKKLPELNDEYVKEQKIEGVETVEAFKADCKAKIIANKENAAKREYISKLVDKIAEGSKADIPEEVIEQQVSSRREDVVNRMKQSGLTLEQYLEFTGTKEEDFVANLKKESIHDVTNFMVMEEIAKKENITVTDAEVEAEMQKIADQYKMKIEDVKKALEPQMAEYVNNLKMTKVEKFLEENNK
ncbi:MAG: trigger factor [Bacilli bacterium]|nr:trigger factor [Bacilli bacterium]